MSAITRYKAMIDRPKEYSYCVSVVVGEVQKSRGQTVAVQIGGSAVDAIEKSESLPIFCVDLGPSGVAVSSCTGGPLPLFRKDFQTQNRFPQFKRPCLLGSKP